MFQQSFFGVLKKVWNPIWFTEALNRAQKDP